MTAEDLLLRVPPRVTEVPVRKGQPQAGVPLRELLPQADLQKAVPIEVPLRQADPREVPIREADLQEAHPAEGHPLHSAVTAVPVQEAHLRGEEGKEEFVLLRAHIYSLPW